MYARFADTANKLLDRFGSDDALLVQPGGEPTFNPGTGEYEGGDDDIEVPIKAVFTPVSTQRIDNQNVLAGDVVVKIATAGLVAVPEVGDKISRGSEQYSILSVRKVQPADTAIIYECHARAD